MTADVISYDDVVLEQGASFIQYDRCPRKKGEIWTQTQREDGRVKTEAETGVMLSQAKEPEAGRGKKAPPWRLQREHGLDFGRLASRIVREQVSVTLSHVFCGTRL